MPSLKFLPTGDYFAEITERIARTRRGDRVALMTMGYNPGVATIGRLTDELIAAAGRGVRVQLNIDAYSFMVDDVSELPTGPLMLRGSLQRLPPAYAKKLACLEKLADHGGGYRILNQPTSRLTNPFAGRSHIKATVINNEAYLGGCNLSHPTLTDAMVRLKDAALADWLHDMILETARSGNVRQAFNDADAIRKLDKTTTIFLDAGIKKQSIIYEQALALIDQAQERIVLTCQFFPGSTTAQHLAAAYERGVDVTVYFNSPRQHPALKSFAMQLVQRYESWQHPKELFSRELPKNTPFLHAKLLATEKAAMIGSHNYVTQGVNLGTAEIALLRKDATFAREVQGLAQRLAEPQV